MSKRLVIKLDYLASTYGLTGKKTFRILPGHRLEMAELEAEVEADLRVIQAIGSHDDEFGTDLRYLTPEDGPEIVAALKEAYA